jgi:hypothetical protein
LRGRRGIIVGDKGSCSDPFTKQLSSQGLRPIAQRKQNMTLNSEEEKDCSRNNRLSKLSSEKLKISSLLPYFAFALQKPLSLSFVPVFSPLISRFNFAIRVIF